MTLSGETLWPLAMKLLASFAATCFATSQEVSLKNFNKRGKKTIV